MKKAATTACVPCTVLITNGKRKQSTEQTVFSHETVAPLSHSQASPVFTFCLRSQ